MIELGYLEGEICNRDGCQGVIKEGDKDRSNGGCSCFINPPCSYCMQDTHYCPKCDWSAADEI